MHEPTIGALLGNVTANTELKDTNIDSRRPPKQWKDPVQICRDLFNFGKPFGLFPRWSVFPNRVPSLDEIALCKRYSVHTTQTSYANHPNIHRC